MRCTTALVQHVDESSGAGYCKPCFKELERTVLSCFYCTVEVEAATRGACTHTAGCEGRAVMCGDCEALHGKRVCARCWTSAWGSGCFACGGPLPTARTWAARFCHACYKARFCTEG